MEIQLLHKPRKRKEVHQAELGDMERLQERRQDRLGEGELFFHLVICIDMGHGEWE